jgi:hypothetical protein
MVAIQILSLAALAIGYDILLRMTLWAFANIDSAIAGPIATTETSQPFKIGITFKNDETLYLTATSTASPNVSDGIKCTIETTGTVGKLSCGPEKKAFTYSQLHTTEPLKPVASDKKNVAWSIGADNVIQWAAEQGSDTKFVTFSRQKKGDQKQIFAEVCTSFDHHAKLPNTKEAEEAKDFWQKGVAKAYFD